MDILHAIFHALTADSGAFYGAVSGWVGDLSLLGGSTLIYRKHNCHVRGCWRLGHHPAGHYAVCRRHHPEVHDKAPTAAGVAASLEDDGEIEDEEGSLVDEPPCRGEVSDIEVVVADTAGLVDEWSTDHGDAEVEEIVREAFNAFERRRLRRPMGFR